MLPSVRERKSDTFAFAVAVGSSKAWYENHVEEMAGKVRRWEKNEISRTGHGQKIRGEYYMVPLSFWQMYFRQS